MIYRKLFISILIFFIASPLLAQHSDSTKAIRRPFALYIGFGPNLYFNNLEIAKDHVNLLNYSFVGRIMWEPEYFLSLGIESGYYRLYTVSVSSATEGSAHIVNNAIPIQVIISMKFLKNYYVNFSMGQTMLLNHSTSSNGADLHAKTWSFADLGAAAGYKFFYKNRFSMGLEAKFFYSTRLDDKNLALVYVAGYRF